MGLFKEFVLNEAKIDSEYLKQFYNKKDSDKETTYFRSEDKWAKITKYKGDKLWRYTMGLKGELKVPEFRAKSSSVKDIAILAVEYWFKDKNA